MRWQPHDYQKYAVEFCVQQGTAGLLLDPGLGKTSIMLTVFYLLRKKGLARRALVIAPLRPAYAVWPAEAQRWDHLNDLRVNVLHGPRKDERLRAEADVDVVNPEGLDWLLRSVKGEWPWDILIVDECFPAGTRVSTTTGGTPIELVRVGDRVHTSAGLRRVLECGTRTVSALVRLHMDDGRSLTCTPEHPIFTEVGWLPAKFCAGRRLYAQADLSRMRRVVSSSTEDHPARRVAENLLAVLRAETDVGELQPTPSKGDREEDGGAPRRQTFVEQGSLVARSASSDDLRASEGPRSDLHGTGWQRDGYDGVREVGCSLFADRVALELRGRIGWEAARLSYLLQAGLRSASEEDRAGSGRGEPPPDSAASSGPQEGGPVGGARVACVEDLEREGTTVYNLRVEGCPHFFAEGVLVHNCTRFKHSNTQRFKLLKPVLHRFKRRYILTGSPAPNGLLDLWGQIYILDGGYSLGLYFSHYRAMYFNPSGFQGYDWKIRGGAEEEIYDKLKPLVLRMSAEDYLELPELINNTVEVELPPAALRTYRQMEATLLADLEDGTVTAANAVAATGKCRQIANGGIYHEGAEEWTHIHQAKTDAVAELVEELSGKPCLIAYEYRHDLERLRKHFPDAPHIGGGVSAGRFREIERSWNRGEVPVLLAQPQSVAHGLNLQGTGAAVIWHSLTWDLEIYEQFIRRVWRQGQKERVFVHHILAKETIDKVIMQMLRSKERTQRALLGALKTHLKGRRAA